MPLGAEAHGKIGHSFAYTYKTQKTAATISKRSKNRMAKNRKAKNSS